MILAFSYLHITACYGVQKLKYVLQIPFSYSKSIKLLFEIFIFAFEIQNFAFGITRNTVLQYMLMAC